jgi:hypothetical protein
MTQDIAQPIINKPSDRFGRLFLMTISALTFAMLLGGIYLTTSYDKGDGLSTYEREAIAVVSMQNEITDGWNQTVDTFNAASVLSENDHVIVFTISQNSARALITDSQAVINRWRAIDVPEEHLAAHELGLEALMATQDGLILYDVFFQDSLDTLVSSQIRSEEASDKLVQARDLWLQAAAMAASEG